MPRPASVTVSAILVVLGSLFTLVLAAAMFWLPTSGGAGIEHERAFAIGLGVVYLVAAATGLATSVGLFRLRRWARVLLLAFAGVLVLFCSFAVLLVALVPMPEVAAPDVPMPPNFRAIAITVFAIPGAIGTWWLVLFTRPRITDAFGGEAVADPSAPPTIVLLIGWLTVIGGVASLAIAWTESPWFFLGIFLEGWGAKASYLAFALFQLYVGRGLLRLEERSRVLAIWFFIVGSLNGVVALLSPGMRARILEFSREADPAAADTFPVDSESFLWWILALSLVVVVAQTWLLVRARPAFHRD